MQDEVLIIGVYGMGGVGKTTLVTHIHNKVIENPSTFNHVFFFFCPFRSFCSHEW
jgi:disease resistance protein RPS2